jgi:MoxR-like ATPase
VGGYTKLFDPPDEQPRRQDGRAAGADRTVDDVYVYRDDEIVLAVNVALATARPLLVSGPPGSGKSSLAPNVARVLDADSKHGRWEYGYHVVTPRTRAEDLLWRYDALRRLRDAQANKLGADDRYLERGVLWTAFERSHKEVRTVVLIDEIDKADPDVPNSLLEVLGNLSFKVAETGEVVTARETFEPLVILTTNDERELPRPFLRRCVTLTLKRPDPKRLEAIAAAHGLAGDPKLAKRLAERVKELVDEAKDSTRRAPSTAEYLDALRACNRLNVTLGSPDWAMVEAATLRKRVDPDGTR